MARTKKEIKSESSRIDEKKLLDLLESNNDIEIIKLSDIEIKVKKYISLEEAIALEEYVIKSCFNDNGEYIPMAKSFSFNTAIMFFYTNLPLISDIHNRYDFMEKTGIIDDIIKVISSKQYYEIQKSIEDNINYRIKIDVEKANMKINEMVSSAEILEEKLESLFKGIEPSDISNAIKAFSASGIDEEKIIKTVLSNEKAKVKK